MFVSPAGRPKIENPKSERLEIRLTKAEAEDIQYCAEKLNTNKTEAINIGIKMLKEELNKK